jgi:general secretion pathway protein J
MTGKETQERGFTLLEMLVALVVFGLVMAGLAQALHFGLTALSAERRATAEPETIADVDAALRRLVEQARPVGFLGRPDGIAFVTVVPLGAMAGGTGKDRLADVAIALAPDHRLVMRFTAHPPGIRLTPQPAPREETLLDGITALRASYLSPVDGGAPAWSDQWAGSGLPLLVRIHIAFADGRNWPDLVAAPIMGDASAGPRKGD